MPEEDGTDKKPLPLEPYMQRRSSLEQTLHDQARSFDKAILTLATGAIALSLVFVEKVAPHPACWTKAFLALAWVLLGLAVLSTLISFLTSQGAHRALIDEWDKTYELQRDPEKSAAGENCDRWTRRLNVFSAAAFAGGVGAFVVFAVGNL